MQPIIFFVVLSALFFSLYRIYSSWKDKQPATLEGGPDAVLQQAMTLLAQGKEQQAFTYLEQAADLGMSHAAQLLAELHCQQGDDTKANHWFKRAAELDEQFADIQRTLLSINAHPTLGGDKSELEAMLKPGADQGDSKLQGELGKLYQDNPLLDPDGSQALHYLEQASDAGNTQAKYDLANLWLAPRHAVKDAAKARSILQSIAESHQHAKSQLAHMLLYGEGGIADPRQAQQILEEQAHESAFNQLELGRFFLYGNGIPQDITKAEHYIRQSISNENESAPLALAELLLEHKRDSDSHREAIALLEPLANAWWTDAHFLLGKAHEKGLGTRRHMPSAWKHYRLAATEPSPDHLARLESISTQMSEYEREQAESLYQEYLLEYPLSKDSQSSIDYGHGLRLLCEDDNGRHDPKEAIKFLERAVLAGEDLALDSLYQACLEVGQRLDAAVWAQIAVETNNFILDTGKAAADLDRLVNSFSEAEQALFELRLEEKRQALKDG